MLFYGHHRMATDDTLRETVLHGKGNYPFAHYIVNVERLDFHCIDWHWHHEVEFLSVTEGKLLCLIGEDRIELTEGSGVFVNSGILHRYEAKGEKTRIQIIVFSPVLLAAEESLLYERYVLPVINSAAAYHILDPQTKWQDEILKVLLEIYYLQESGRKNELRTVRLILEMWDTLFEYLDTSSETNGICHVNHRQAKLQIMMQYIHDHYDGQIALGEIAEAAAISKSSALNIFQTCIHISPVSYLIRYRLQCAGGLLYTTEKSVTVIAEETGFSSVGYFCRKFKEHYHMSPGEYRRRRANITSVSSRGDCR